MAIREDSVSSEENIPASGEEGDVSLLEEDLPEDDNITDDELEDDENKDEKEVDLEDDDKEDEEDEEKEEEEDEEDDNKEDETETELEAQVNLKTLKSKYPNILKEFPQLRHVISQHAEYGKMFGGVKLAEEVAEKANIFNQLEGTLLQGKSLPLLQTLAKTSSPVGFERFVRSLYPTLMNGSPQTALRHLVSPVVKHTLRSILSDANISNTIRSSVRNVSLYLFKQLDVPEDEDFDNDPRTRQMEEQEKTVRETKASSFSSGLKQLTTKRLDKLINNDIDPKKQLPSFTLDAANVKIRKMISTKLSEDKRFGSMMDRLYDNTTRNGFTEEDKTRLLNAYLGRVRILLPGIKRVVLKEAFESLNKPRQSRNTSSGGAPSSGKTKPRIDLNKHTDEEILGM